MPKGLAEDILGNKLTIIEFPEMIHGWTIRGGKLEFKLMVKFFEYVIYFQICPNLKLNEMLNWQFTKL